MVGALLVVAAVFGVFAVTARADDTPSTNYVVVARTIAIGSRLTPMDLRLEPIDLPSSTASTAFASLDEAIDAVTLAPLSSGDLLTRSAVLAGETAGAAPPSAEFSFAIERDHAVDGALQPGERVDVLATYATAGSGHTEVVTRSARITSIGDGRSDTLAAPSTLVITLALTDPTDVLALAHAKETAAVTVVRTTRADDAPSPDRYEPAAGASGTGTP